MNNSYNEADDEVAGTFCDENDSMIKYMNMVKSFHNQNRKEAHLDRFLINKGTNNTNNSNNRESHNTSFNSKESLRTPQKFDNESFYKASGHEFSPRRPKSKNIQDLSPFPIRHNKKK